MTRRALRPLREVVTVIFAPTSAGDRFLVDAKTKWARDWLASIYGKPTPGGGHVLDASELEELRSKVTGAAR